MTKKSDLVPCVLMVCTREIVSGATWGRERTMESIYSGLSSHGKTQVLRLHSLLEDRSLRRVFDVAWYMVKRTLHCAPPPLQSLLFYDSCYLAQIQSAIVEFKPETIYFDGIRSGLFVPMIKDRFPTIRIVCDFDDLMSHRMESIAKSGVSISLGYLKRYFPLWIQKFFLEGAISRIFLKYERLALLRAEREISEYCDAIVLVSSVEGEILRKQVPRSRVEVIPPVIPSRHVEFSGGVISRFIFVGSDGMNQNRLTIKYLLNVWERLRPTIPLHIYGKQNNHYRAVSGVVFEGFVHDVAEAYTPGSMMLAPAFLNGGVKTKVLEAMSYNVIPVGNRVTFDGVQADCSALVLTEEEMFDLIQHPTHWVNSLLVEGEKVIYEAKTSHSEERVISSWVKVIWP